MTAIIPINKEGPLIEEGLELITSKARDIHDFDEFVSSIVDLYDSNYPSDYKILDKRAIKASINFAHRAHLGQKRDSGDMALVHPLHVGYILSYWWLDTTTTAGGILHDTREDGDLYNILKTDRTVHNFENLSEREIGMRILSKIGKEIGSYDSISTFKLYIMLNAVTTHEEDRTIRDLLMYNKIVDSTKRHNTMDICNLKLADVIANLYTKKYMKPKNGYTAEERIEIYSKNVSRFALPIAEFADYKLTFKNPITPYILELVDR